jgi:hypothetical protein
MVWTRPATHKLMPAFQMPSGFAMLPPDNGANVPLFWVALGGLATSCAGGFGILWGAINGVRREGERGREKIWNRITELTDDDTERRVKMAGSVTTRQDLAELKDELLDSLSREMVSLQSRVSDIVRNELSERKPVRK